MGTGSACIPFSASWRPFASFERHSSSLVLQLLLPSGQVSSAARQWVLCPHCSTQREGGLLSCKAQSCWPMTWWAGQTDTEKNAWYAKELEQAWEIHFSQALQIPTYSLFHAVSCEVGHRKPKSRKISLCLSNLAIASIQITFFMFYRKCLVRSKEQLRDFLRGWLSTIHVRLQQAQLFTPIVPMAGGETP